jgi:hypothetical protein
MSVATSLERIKERVPSGYTLLKITVPTVLGYMLGKAIINPSQRVVETLVGFFLAAAALLIKPSRAIAVFVVLFLFPAHLSIGSSNTVFILILLSTWVAQQVLAGKKISIKTPLDPPILLMSAAYLLSLINVPQGVYGANFRALSVFFTSVAIYYLVVNLTTDAAGVRRLLLAGTIGAAIMGAIGLYEIFSPYKQLLPYFLIASGIPAGAGAVRAGSGFRNASVLSQYCLFYLMLGMLLFGREKSRFLRFLLALFFAAFLIVFGSTAMRGAVMAGVAGLAFLVWRSKIVFNRGRVVVVVLTSVAIFLVADYMLSSAGLVPNVLRRFSEFEQRLGSHTNRAAVMQEVYERGKEHPFVGHGPAVSLPRGFVATGSENPHCQYALYFYTIGFLGLGGFIWLLISLFRISSGVFRVASSNKSLLSLMVILQTFLVIFVLHEAVDDYSSSLNYPLFIWYVFGLIVATRNVLLKEASLATAGSEPKLRNTLA